MSDLDSPRALLDVVLATTSLSLLLAMLVLAHVGRRNFAAPRPARSCRRSGRPLDPSAWLVLVLVGARVP
jgi:hypothetical protein